MLDLHDVHGVRELGWEIQDAEIIAQRHPDLDPAAVILVDPRTCIGRAQALSRHGIDIGRQVLPREPIRRIVEVDPMVAHEVEDRGVIGIRHW